MSEISQSEMDNVGRGAEVIAEYLISNLKWERNEVLQSSIYANSISNEKLADRDCTIANQRREIIRLKEQLAEKDKEIESRNNYYENKIEQLNRAYSNEYRENQDLIKRVAELEKVLMDIRQILKDYINH